MAEVLTVRKALQLEVFQRTEVRIYAGEKHLDRPVRWVHAGEIPDIHRFLSGQEMLLTAGLGMGDTGDLQRAFVRRVSDARASVLVIELAGRMFDVMPAAVVEEAEAVDLPLVGLRDEIPFVEASAQVHEVLVENRMSQLIADEATGQAFMNLLLADQDYLAMTDEVARRTGLPVVLENVAHQMLAYSGATPESDAIVADWGAHSRAIHERHRPAISERRGAPTARPGSFRNVVACARRAVVLRGESWGWMHLLHGATQPTPADLNTLERAAAAVAISLLSERESGARSAQRQGALLNRLMLGDITGEEFVQNALGLGRDLRDKPLLVVVSARGEADGRDDSSLQAVERAVGGLGLNAVVGDIGDFALAVVALDRDVTGDRLARSLADAGNWGGLSRAVPAAGLQTAVRQGRSAASAAVATRADQFLRFDDLGALRLLVALAEGPELARYVEDELGPLLSHDAQSSNPLLPTLRAFLDAGGNKARTAEVLFVQRRTLYYRLDRITRILGLDLSSSDTQQRLQLAVRGHDLLRHSAPRRR
ncbi:PucR family transcriptional regulator [Pseudonocardia halophobica]|uniref:PucR family transcriptional regulator n=1 Tax=Pseudonocardia halophobica TaxID=29401 RepID=UPI003D925668